MEARRLKHPRSNWSRTVLVCGKCSKKLGGGFGEKGRAPLARALRRHLAVGKGRTAPIGIVEVKCLGICPKGAVTVVDAGAPGEWLIVRGGTGAAQVAEALELYPVRGMNAVL